MQCNIEDALFDYLRHIDQIIYVIWFNWPMLLITLIVFITVSINTEI